MSSRRFRIALLAALAAIGCFGMQGSVQAATPYYSTQHASMCRPGGFMEGNAVFLEVNSRGVRNWALATSTVVCPVIRDGWAPTTSFTVWVDGYAAGPTSCTLYSQDYQRNPLGSVSFTVPTNTFDRALTLPASQVPAYSTQVVVCSLPSGGELWDVEPVSN